MLRIQEKGLAAIQIIRIEGYTQPPILSDLHKKPFGSEKCLQIEDELHGKSYIDFYVIKTNLLFFLDSYSVILC